MNRVIQINIIQAENGFLVQSPTGAQHVAANETEVQAVIQKLLPDMLKEPKPFVPKTQTFKGTLGVQKAKE